MNSSSCLKVAYVKPGRRCSEADMLLGRWYCMTYGFTIEILKSEEQYNGKVFFSNNSDELPGPLVTNLYPVGGSLFSGSLNAIYLPFISGLLYNAKSRKWEGGRIIDYLTGKTKFMKAWITGDNSLIIRQYCKFIILGKDISFIRAKQ